MNVNKRTKESVNELPKTTKPTWSVVEEVLQGEYGSFQSPNDTKIADIAKNMKLSHHLNEPAGVVQVVNFNKRGNLICAASFSDEGKSNAIGLIDWADNEVKATLNTEKATKVSDVHYLNANNDEDQLTVVSAYESGKIRCDNLAPTGVVEALQSYQLSVERHKLALCPGSQHEVLSASLSGKIFSIDLRCEQQQTASPAVLAETVAAGRNVRLQSISHHPLVPQICASYDDFHVRTFDKRRFDRALHEICTERLKSRKKPAVISDCFYNYDGSEILAIYTDTEIFLFDSENKKPGEFKNTFDQFGFLAGFTNKTCFFGPKSEYVVVGDDGQRIAFIDKVTGEYVGNTALWADGRWCSFYFNDLKPHPNLPIVVAASGHFSILGPTNIEEITAREAVKLKKSRACNVF